MPKTDPFTYPANREQPFPVPEGYFEKLPGQAESHALALDKRKSRVLPIVLASSFILMLTASAVLLLLNNIGGHYPVETAELRALIVDEMNLHEVSLPEEAIELSSFTIDWERTIEDNLLKGADADEIAEYLFEIDDFEF
ncbi:MAG TPA: hypothetical protein PKE03_08210 [Bacteroidales bacterium]|nr:hypothetical protein [Bacteroidales bacterium]